MNQTTVTLFEGKQWIAKTNNRHRVYLRLEIRQNHDTKQGTDHHEYHDPIELTMGYQICFGPIDLHHTNGFGNVNGIREYVMPTISSYVGMWDRELLDLVARGGEIWHLNGLSAGCQHQHSGKWEDVKDQLCPVNDYKYDRSWLYRPIPPAVVNWALALFNSPLRVGLTPDNRYVVLQGGK